MSNREIMQQALEALELPEGLNNHEERVLGRACAALRAALSEPVQEPFGYLWPTGMHPEFRFTQQQRDGVDGMPVYASPAPTAEDIAQDWDLLKATQESLREHMAEIQRLRAALAEDALQRLTDVQQEMEAALAEQCQHGVTDGNCKECYVAEQEQQPVEWLTGCPECGMDGGCDCPSGTWNPPEQELVIDCPRCGHCCPQPQQQEPVAWMDKDGDVYPMPENKNWAPPHTMLYTAPPQRKPLTDEQVNECGMCGYVGKDKDKTGQCPKCRWDELRPLTGKAHQKPLTDDQIYEMYNEPRSDAEMLEFARAIEAAHGIKGEA